MSSFLYGQNSPYKLVINPYTEVLPDIKYSIDRVDVKINRYDLARKIYDALIQPNYKSILEVRAFNETIINLKNFIKDYNGKQFSDSVRLVIFPYKPDILLFSSIDKENEMVVLKAEIFDLSAKSIAAKNRKINFEDFKNDDALVNQEIKQLAKELICELTGCKPAFGFISLKEYEKTLDNLKYGIGMGFGYATGNKLTLENISKDLRTIPPHDDDVRYRGNEILPVNIPDNYLVRENSVDINLGQRLSFDVMQISFWGIVNLAIRTTSINESGQTLNQNLYRKWYVTNNINDPDNPSSGTAYIYYGIKSKSRNFFERKSFSLPLFITYPVLYAGRKKEVICKLLGGTNILLPAKIELESEKGWYRFGEYEIQNKNSTSDLKEIEWFAGIDIEGSPSKTLKLGFQFIRVYSDYKGDFNVPLSFKQQENGTTSLRINLIKMF